MRITNKLGLPSPIIRAVTPKRDPQTRRGGADISVTELVGPPRIKQLRDSHWDDIVEDASDLLYALYGTIGHDILSKHAAGKLSEQRLRSEFLVGSRRMIVSGQFDLVEDDDGVRVLSDYKFASAWTYVFGRDEWEYQLNIYRYLLVDNGLGDVGRLQNVLLFRDWHRRDAERNSEYPKGRAAVLNQPLWPMEKTRAYIMGRLAEHLKEMPECTDDEKMVKLEAVAVQKPGAKRALRVFEEKRDRPGAAAEDAARFMNEFTAQNPHIQLETVVRESEPLRCKEFCSVWHWCEFGRSIRGFVPGEPE